VTSSRVGSRAARSASSSVVHVAAQLAVERAERLVEQQHARLADEGPRERDPLRLAAGELVHPPTAVPRQLHQLKVLPGPLAGGSATDARDPQREGDVVDDGQVREQQRALGEHGDAAALRRNAGQVAPVAVHRPGRRAASIEVGAGDHASH